MTSGFRAISQPLWLGLVASVLALGLSACQTDAPPPPPVKADPGPPVSLSPLVSDAASIYVSYIESAKSMSNEFSDPAMIQAALSQGASYEPKQLGRGAVAYAAIVAMQEPAFRSQLRAYASSETTRREMVNNLLSNPAYVASLPSANIAARRAILALSSDGEALYAKGTEFKQSAYSIQKQKWSQGVIASPQLRLAATKQSSSQGLGVSSDKSSKLLVAALTGEGLVSEATTGSMSQDMSQGSNPAAKKLLATGAQGADFDRETLFNAPYTHGINRALAIAAISILGEGTGSNEEPISQLLNDGNSPRCLGESKLNLNQCLAASRFHFDDVFCVGQHILMDTGNCIGQMSSNALNLSPKREVTMNADGTEALKYANAKPYIKPAATKKAPAKKKPASKTQAKKNN
jgi:hypothetical protein